MKVSNVVKENIVCSESQVASVSFRVLQLLAFAPGIQPVPILWHKLVMHDTLKSKNNFGYSVHVACWYWMDIQVEVAWSYPAEML